MGLPTPVVITEENKDIESMVRSATEPDFMIDLSKVIKSTTAKSRKTQSTLICMRAELIAFIVGGLLAYILLKSGQNENSEEFSGIVVNEEEAKKGVCKRIDDTNLYYSKGIIGALNEEQKKKYCKKVIKVIPSRRVVEIPFDHFMKYIELTEKTRQKSEEILKNKK